MNISELCIKRPVFATVLSLLILLVGLVAADRLSLREYPRVDKPIINIWTRYTGATAEVIESEVTAPIEELMSGLEGVDFINSSSRAGASNINITFKQGRDIEAAAADVRDRLDRVTFSLPKDVTPPVLWKQEADLNPLLWITVSSSSRNIMELTEIADNQIRDKLLIVEGVGEIVTWAGREYAMRVWIDRTALAGYGLTIYEVEESMRQQNLDLPSGQVETDHFELNIHAQTSLKTPEEFSQIIIAEKDDYLVRLGDVAKIELGASEQVNSAKLNNVHTLGLGIRLQSVANPLDVARKIKSELKKIVPTLPEDVQANVATDTSISIERSITNVFSSFYEAIILVILVIFFFLRSPRATLIPAVTIPISLIGVNALMWWWGFSLNTLTLLAMVLGIGIVVDDAIVVLENIHRHIENGSTPRKAAIDGSKEIFFPVVAMTLTLAAVFAPLGFSEGSTGKLFIEFALTLAGAVVISGFTALTLTPVMCSGLLKPHGNQSQHRNSSFSAFKIGDAIEANIKKLNQAYTKVSRRALKKPIIGLVVLLITFPLAITLTNNLPKELAPTEDNGRVMVIGIAPEGTTVNYGEKYTEDLVSKILDIPEIDIVFANYGIPTANMHSMTIVLKDWSERERSQNEVHEEIKQLISTEPGMIFITMDQAPLGQRSRERPINLLLQSSLPYEELAVIAEQVTNKLRKDPLLSGVNLDLTLNKPQLEVSLNRDKMADDGIEVGTVGRTLETLFGGRQVTKFQRGVKKYDVIVQLEENERSQPSDIREIYVRNDKGELILLEDVINLEETIVPRQLNHFNKLRVAAITANPASGYTLGEALDSAVNDINSMNLENINLEYGGQSREYLQSSQQIYFTALMSLIFIYLVLAAQFESFRDPLIILLAVPFAILGASIFLNLTGKSFSIFSQIGIITLVGLITKHGIMLVDTANRLRLEGMEKFEAMVEACAQRFRPIVMTTAAMVLGSIPLALATGAGAESRSQIGWVIVGGLLIGTVMTLLVTPSLYLLISKNKLRAID